MEYRFKASLWEYQGEAPWVFVTLPQELADEIDERVPDRRGFGSVRVEVVIGNSQWQTSIFPDKSSGSFVLPVKRAIRQEQGLFPGDEASLTLRVEVDA